LPHRALPFPADDLLCFQFREKLQRLLLNQRLRAVELPTQTGEELRGIRLLSQQFPNARGGPVQGEEPFCFRMEENNGVSYRPGQHPIGDLVLHLILAHQPGPYIAQHSRLHLCIREWARGHPKVQALPVKS
jgi:hypothetical protein